MCCLGFALFAASLFLVAGPPTIVESSETRIGEKIIPLPDWWVLVNLPASPAPFGMFPFGKHLPDTIESEKIS